MRARIAHEKGDVTPNCKEGLTNPHIRGPAGCLLLHWYTG